MTPPDPEMPRFKGIPQTGNVTPLSESEPITTGAPPPLLAASPPPLPPQPTRTSGSLRVLAIALSLYLGLFLADAVISLLDDSLILCFDFHVLTAMRGFLFFLAMLMAVVLYGLMGLTPMIPKRLFLPLALFSPVAGLLAIPMLIYFFGRIQQIAWGISFCQVILGLSILYWAQGGWKLHWPLMVESRLQSRQFSWRNLCLFLLVNVFVLLPGVIVYLVYCAVLAVDHFSEGFVTLRPDGLTVQARRYVRHDGKTIQLFPMSHVGETDFYQKLSKSFPTNSIILMEGVTDDRNLLTNKISYKRMAASLGVSEQQTEFKPRGKLVRADVDIEQFTTSTIDFLNAVMLVHSKGLNAQTMLVLTQYSPPPRFEEHLLDDLLRKRNRRLLEEIRVRLSQSDHITVPWGAAHMPEIAREIQKSGFRLVESQDYLAIRFRPAATTNQTTGKGEASEQPK